MLKKICIWVQIFQVSRKLCLSFVANIPFHGKKKKKKKAMPIIYIWYILGRKIRLEIRLFIEKQGTTHMEEIKKREIVTAKMSSSLHLVISK